jgi:hypothetical protein
MPSTPTTIGFTERSISLRVSIRIFRAHLRVLVWSLSRVCS